MAYPTFWNKPSSLLQVEECLLLLAQGTQTTRLFGELLAFWTLYTSP